MEQFKTWEEMSVLEQYACTYWDMYKDAHGVRPRGIDTSSWTEQDFEREFEYLQQVIDQEYKARREAEAGAARDFEERIGEFIALGAGDRERSIPIQDSNRRRIYRFLDALLLTSITLGAREGIVS